MSTRTPPPLRPALTEAQVARIWARVQAGPQRRSRALVLAAGSLSVAALSVFLVLQPWRSPGLLPVGEVVEAARELADGSRIAPEPGAVLEVLRSTGTELATLQRSGRCRYAVTEGGPRRWVVETELGVVEVLGTIFTVDVRPEGLAVSVERGKVFVRGNGRAMTLRAGESVLVGRENAERLVEASREPAKEPPNDEAPAERPADEPPVESPPAGPVGSSPESPQSPESPRSPTSRDPAATAALGAPPPTPSAPAPARPMSARDVLAAVEPLDADQAVPRLVAWLHEAPRDVDWAIVALKLGTLQLEDTAQPLEALDHFDAVIRIGAPPTAVEDASYRRVEALRALKRKQEALEAAEAFRARWPSSPWVSELPTRATLRP